MVTMNQRRRKMECKSYWRPRRRGQCAATCVAVASGSHPLVLYDALMLSMTMEGGQVVAIEVRGEMIMPTESSISEQ